MMEKSRHPRELPILFLTEMWERFSFYLMVGILPLYLTNSSKGGLGWSDADGRGPGRKLHGNGVLHAIHRRPDRRPSPGLPQDHPHRRHINDARPPGPGPPAGLYIGLVLLVLGNGAFKPNISTLLGNLYPPGSPLKDTGYNIFYMGINVGAFVCNFVAALVRNHFDDHPWQITSTWTLTGWHAAFGTAAIGMFIGLVLFSSFYGRFAKADQQPTSAVGSVGESMGPLFLKCLLPAAILAALRLVPGRQRRHSEAFAGRAEAAHDGISGACIPVILFYIGIWSSVPDRGDRGRVAALLIVFTIVIIFWGTYGLNIPR